MPKPSQSGRKRFFYNQNIKRDKSGDKYKNLIEHTIMLLKRLEKEGMTKWIANALNRAQAKIKSYGITATQVTAAINHKGLTSLDKALNDHLVFVQKKGQNINISTKRDVLPKKKLITASGTVAKKTTEKKETVKPVVEKKAATKKTETKSPVVKKETVKETVKKVAPKKVPAKTTEKKPTAKKTAK